MDNVEIEEKDEEYVKSLAEVLFADAAIEEAQMGNQTNKASTSDPTNIKTPSTGPTLLKAASHDAGLIKKRPTGKLASHEKDGAERGKSTQAD